ncbi:predicted protein [Nematostella vectensis]|uniref:glutamate carboxypeptidase II n=1 Tax=Nematostella vectensis TaxID=45351 RepID=A7S002_NEMVE|nr:predicted protein [Nematostella vectensis]|eukprot:XP_001634994.1 predicted protein [Nematostella vectensis]
MRINNLNNKEKHFCVFRYLTSRPHIAASARNLELAENISETWKNLGFGSVKKVKYNVLLSFPTKNKTNGAMLLDGNGDVKFETAKQNKPVEPSEDSPDAYPPYSAYSPTGVETGELVFANYGSPDDFSYLKSKGINVTNKIAIIKYGKVFRGDKVTNAAKAGAKAAILFNDPKDFGPVPDDQLYPNGWWLPRTGVERGSVLLGTGDPLTPRYPAKEGVYRGFSSDIPLPTIPAHPISADDAKVFLSKMSGPDAPDDWQGGLNITYRLGPGFVRPYENWTVKVETNNDHVSKDIYNVIAVIKGREEPDRLVLLGNHRDAWVFGGTDPSSGTACMLEMSRILGHMLRTGWRPRRSIVLGSWGGEEFGLIGSTEWVEDNLHTLYQRGIAYINVDSPVRGNYTFFAWASPLLNQVLYEATKLVPDPVNQNVSVYYNWLKRSPGDGNQPRMCFSRIYGLGSGSDYAPFYLRAWTPGNGFEIHKKFHGVSSYPTYHSLHDTFNYAKKFLDPHFYTHMTMARIWLAVVYQLAEKPLLPLRLHDYLGVVNGSALALQKKYGTQLKNRNISLDFLFRSINNFGNGVKVMNSMIKNTILNDTLALRMLNDRLMGVEKTFLNFAGLPKRPLYWHSVFAPSLYNSYASVTFPGLSDALTDASKSGDWDLVRRQISEVAIAIDWTAQFLAESV